MLKNMDHQIQRFEALTTNELRTMAEQNPDDLLIGDWKRILTPSEFKITRLKDTERAFSSPLNYVRDDGVFACKGCKNNLFEMNTKYDSGTGWPSFYKPVDETTAITTVLDYGIGWWASWASWFSWIVGKPRVEVICFRCKAHLGHVFEDGPKPTGNRYCINGSAMDFNKRP